MRQAPPMTGLRVLEAVVRTGTLSAAARELCVTPAAVSHRLRSLQAGGALVRRQGGRFLATDLGQRVLETLGDAFARIKAADALLTAPPPGLRIRASYSFAVLWLAPRLSRFEAAHPGVRLVLEPSHGPLDEGPADVTILHAAEAPGPGWTRLFADRCAVVARADHPPVRAPGDVLTARLVTVAHGRGADHGEFSWPRWALSLGLTPPAEVRGPTVTAEHLAVDLVLAEDALALVGLVNAARLIEQGRLRTIPGTEAASGCSYWARAGEGSLSRAFLAWMAQELA